MLPGLDGLSLIREMRRRGISTPVLILSMHLNEAYVTRALQAGATGYLLKDSADADLILGVSAIAVGIECVT